MRIHWLAKVGAVVVALSPVAARALVAPHDRSFTDGDCSNCHTLSNATPLGGMDYSAGCNACHAGQTGSKLAFPNSTIEAKPGVKGTHHSWSGFGDNPAMGAIRPPSADFARRLADGRLQCAVCHDLHNANPDASPDARSTSIDVGQPQDPLPGATGAAKMTLVSPGTNMAVGYRIRLQSATSFIISKTARQSGGASWLKWSGGWVAGTGALSDPGLTFTAGTPVVIEGDLSVSFTTGGQPGDQWEFWVSYPGLRLTMKTNALCVYCHRTMGMGTQRAAGKDPGYPVDGTRVFSHPVGEGLNANGLGTDRVAILDGDGSTQSVGDSNPTNDLVLEGAVVRCTTCHAVHGADSNSLTVDKR